MTTGVLDNQTDGKSRDEAARRISCSSAVKRRTTKRGKRWNPCWHQQQRQERCQALLPPDLAVVLLQDHDDGVAELVGFGDVVNPEDTGEAVAAGLRVCERRRVVLVAPEAELFAPSKVAVRLHSNHQKRKNKALIGGRTLHSCTVGTHKSSSFPLLGSQLPARYCAGELHQGRDMLGLHH